MIPYGKHDISPQDIEAVCDVLRSDFITQGPKVPEFEEKVKKQVKAQFAVAVNSATSALHIACLALGVKPGDKVWTSPITFVASANAALYCGADVDFVDVQASTGNMCPEALAKKLQAAEKDQALPKVIIPVHFAGHSCDMKSIAELARAYDIKLLEDASHAIGGTYCDKAIGACEYSDITVFSFHPVKVITSAEGGVATTNDQQLAKTMTSLRSHGVTRDSAQLMDRHQGAWYYEQQMLGFNYRLSDIHAALGCSQLDRLQKIVTARNNIAQRYIAQLDGVVDQIVYPMADTYSSYHLMVVLLPEKADRKQIFDGMRAAGIGVHVHYIPVHLQPYYQGVGFALGDFPHAEAFYERCLTLPIYPSLSVEQQDYINQTLLELLT